MGMQRAAWGARGIVWSHGVPPISVVSVFVGEPGADPWGNGGLPI